MNKTFVLILLFLTSMNLHGNSYDSFLAESISKRFINALGDNEIVAVDLNLVRGDLAKISSLSVLIDGVSITVPVDEFSWYSSPEMNAIEVKVIDTFRYSVVFVTLEFSSGRVVLEDKNTRKGKGVAVYLVFKDSQYMGQLIHIRSENRIYSYYKQRGRDYCSENLDELSKITDKDYSLRPPDNSAKGVNPFEISN